MTAEFEPTAAALTSTIDAGPQSAPPVCLIVLREMLIAHDLTLMIGDARPDLEVRWADTHAAALQHLKDDVPVVLAMVDLPPQDFSISELAARVAASKALLIHLGHDVQNRDVTNNVRALPYPFGLDDVLGILAALPTKTAPCASAGG